MKIALDGRLFLDRPLDPQSIQLRQWLEQLAGATAPLQVNIFTPQGSYSAEEFLRNPPAARTTSMWKRVWFEQWDFPRVTRSAGIDLLLYPQSIAPLASTIPAVCFGGMPAYRPPYRFPERIGSALGEAGRSNAVAELWPGDRAARPPAANHLRFLPFVDPRFNPKSGPADKQIRESYGLPYDYVLVHGSANLEAVLAAWTWVVSGAGEYYSLLILADNGEIDPSIETRAEDFGISGTVQLLTGVDHEDIPAIYRGASVFISVGEDDSGNSLRWGLASSVPVAGFQEPPDEPIVGEAAYLVEPDQTRSLGAAVLSLLVQTELADELRGAGLKRAKPYQTEKALNSLSQTLLQIGGGG